LPPFDFTAALKWGFEEELAYLTVLSVQVEMKCRPFCFIIKCGCKLHH